MYCNIHHGIIQSKQAYKKVKKVTWGESNTLSLRLHSWYPKVKQYLPYLQKIHHNKRTKQAAETMKKKNNGFVIHR